MDEVNIAQQPASASHRVKRWNVQKPKPMPMPKPNPNPAFGVDALKSLLRGGGLSAGTPQMCRKARPAYNTAFAPTPSLRFVPDRGKRRALHFSIALGSARESTVCLQLAEATRILPAALDLPKLLDLLDHIQAMLWKLSR